MSDRYFVRRVSRRSFAVIDRTNGVPVHDDEDRPVAFDSYDEAEECEENLNRTAERLDD